MNTCLFFSFEHFSFSVKLSKDWFHSEMKTRLFLFCRWLLSSLPARLIPSHHIFLCWSVGPALENYWWEQSHERLLLTSLMCCSFYTTPSSLTGLPVVRYHDGVDRRGWDNQWLLILMLRYLLLNLLKLIVSKKQLERKCFHLYAYLSESSNHFSSCSTDCISMASSIWAFDPTCILSEIVCLMNIYQHGHNDLDTQ